MTERGINDTIENVKMGVKELSHPPKADGLARKKGEEYGKKV